MTSESLKIRAMDGSALVEGALSLQGEGPLAAALPCAGPGDLIGVALARRRRLAIGLYERWCRAGDGLYAAGPPAANIAFGEAMPGLHRLASQMYGEQPRKMLLRGEGTRLLTVYFRPVGIGDVPLAFAHLEEVTVELARREAGLAVRLEGPVVPFAIEKGGAILEGVRLECEILLPTAYCRLNSIGMFSHSWERRGEWHEGDRSLEALPISWAAFGPGTVDWGQDPQGYRCKGPFVQAVLGENEMTVRPARRVWLTADGTGFAELDSDGPEMRLGLGRAMFASLLEHGDRAAASFPTGIGHVDGQTGRSVGECGGPMRQAIRRLELRLDRRRDELWIEGEGELEPLAPELAAAVGSLGPRLQFGCALSRTWLLARGIELPRFFDDWRGELGVADVW